MLSVIFDNLGLIAAGGGGAVATVVGIKGVPASLAWIKAKWNLAKSDLTSVKADVASAQTAVAALEAKFTPQLTQLTNDVAAIKTKVGGF